MDKDSLFTKPNEAQETQYSPSELKLHKTVNKKELQGGK